MKCLQTLISFRLLTAALMLCTLLSVSPARTTAQTPPGASDPAADQDAPTIDEVLTPEEQEKPIETPDKVEVKPVAVDEDISARLERIFQATGWFESPQVTTDQGVVFLKGLADTQQHREWAERVAQRTSDVVAVVNRINVKASPVWDTAPAMGQLRQLSRDFMQLMPLLAIGTVIVVLFYAFAQLAAMLVRHLMARRIDSQLLMQVLTSVVGVLVMLVGVYIALKVSGLSRLAVTVLGGTGLVGLALGFAFRDIAENYLASILISLQRPFSVGDLIEVANHQGFVRRVTTRGTLLLTVEGNHIQIPNNMMYKSVIVNYSSSPRVRKAFSIGIGYDDSVADAQEVVHRVLEQHISVLQDPAPLVLVDSLGTSTVNLKVLFWLDTKRFDADSVCSALMRQSKSALTEANISLPDEAREVIFPHGVPVTMLNMPARSEARVEDLPAAPRQPAMKTAEKVAEKVAEKIAEQPAEKAKPADKEQANIAEGNLENTSDKLQQHAAATENQDAENLID